MSPVLGRSPLFSARCRVIVFAAAAMVVWLTVATSSTADEADPPPAPVAEAAEPTLWDVVSHSLSEPLVLAFLIIGIGMAIGSIRLFGLSLGSSGVLFAALAFGHFGKSEGWTMPEGLGTLGLVLFVYAVINL